MSIPSWGFFSSLVLYSRVRKAALVGIGIVALLALGHSYNGLVHLDQAVWVQWGQVENAYQRRTDLVPNLVDTAKGAAAFEKDIFAKVAEARANVARISGERGQQVLSDPEAFKRAQQAQDELSSTLSRLMAVSERYPDLKASTRFRDLQMQLEGTENRITVERTRFSDAAQAFDAKRVSFPTLVVASFFGRRFCDKPYFQAQASSNIAPKMKF